MINLDLVKENFTKRTKAVVAVHYGSHIVDVNEIKHFCTENKILLIEDAAQAFGSKIDNINAGTVGDYGCYSFHETKNIHCGLGGAFVRIMKKAMKKQSRYGSEAQIGKKKLEVWLINILGWS